jgi:hypothetical protein
MVRLFTACLMTFVMTVVLWGQCTDCPFFKPQPAPSHGCCQKNQTAPPQNDRCADQDQKLQAYQQADFSKILPAPTVVEISGELEPATAAEHHPGVPEAPRSDLYVLNSTLRI